ncbi:MAG: tetratricopeptide repeat protein [Magnetococcales bacterium]|nr:tetratricopeptide repeat protein [Magnetococcales bacterium]
MESGLPVESQPASLHDPRTVANEQRPEPQPDPPPVPRTMVDRRRPESQPDSPPPPATPSGDIPRRSRADKRFSLPQIGKRVWLLGGGIVLLFGLGMGIYFYMALAEDASRGATPARKSPSRTATHPAPPAAAPPGPAAGKTAPAPPPAPPAPALQQPVKTQEKTKDPEPPIVVLQPPTPAEAAPSRMTSRSMNNPPDPPSREDNPEKKGASRASSPKKNSSPAKTPPVYVESATPLQRGRKAFLSGDLITAKREFELVLRSEPHNHSAMAGLASIAIRNNKPELARTIYQSILQENPRHSLAIAALVSLNGSADPAQIESRLQQLMRDTPNEASLYFALGNVYVEQNNWSEAQSAFFNAYRLEPDNPDILLNLAVSLDHLAQERAALRFYRDAIKLMELRGGAGFDIRNVQHRITVLEQRVKES